MATYINPPYFYEGQEVWIRASIVVRDAKPGTGLRCKVIAPHGDHARVVNEKYGFDSLVSKWSVYVKDERTGQCTS